MDPSVASLINGGFDMPRATSAPPHLEQLWGAPGLVRF
jgi:hypothetical protein